MQMVHVLVLSVFVAFLGGVRGGDVTFLTDKDFEEFVQAHEFVLISGPWILLILSVCGNSYWSSLALPPSPRFAPLRPLV